MGIDSERFVHAVPQDSYCFLCSMVLEDPDEIIECGHFFCHQCLENWKTDRSFKQRKQKQKAKNADVITTTIKQKIPVEIKQGQTYSEEEELQENVSSTCPYCGIDIDFSRVRKSKLIWNLIQNMNVYCNHKSSGCEVVYKYGFEDLHRENCVYEQLNKIEYNNNNNSTSTPSEKELESIKCPTCRNVLGEDINSHDCMKELSIRVQEQASIVTNLEHENHRLMFKLSNCEKQFLDERTEVESQFYLESLRYNKEIRDLRTRVANLQGELAVMNGQVSPLECVFFNYMA